MANISISQILLLYITRDSMLLTFIWQEQTLFLWNFRNEWNHLPLSTQYRHFETNLLGKQNVILENYNCYEKSWQTLREMKMEIFESISEYFLKMKDLTMLKAIFELTTFKGSFLLFLWGTNCSHHLFRHNGNLRTKEKMLLDQYKMMK